MAWVGLAICGGLGHLFFAPDEGKKEQGRYARVQKARAICDQCPVKAPCAEYAITYNENEGIWGGLSERQRRAERRRRKMK